MNKDEYIKLPEILKDGDRFNRRSAGTTSHYYEISKEEYDRITATPNYSCELDKSFKHTASDSILWGYGFYGCDVVEVDGKYYYKECIGNSCD